MSGHCWLYELPSHLCYEKRVIHNTTLQKEKLEGRTDTLDYFMHQIVVCKSVCYTCIYTIYDEERVYLMPFHYTTHYNLKEKI